MRRKGETGVQQPGRAHIILHRGYVEQSTSGDDRVDGSKDRGGHTEGVVHTLSMAQNE